MISVYQYFQLIINYFHVILIAGYAGVKRLSMILTLQSK